MSSVVNQVTGFTSPSRTDTPLRQATDDDHSRERIFYTPTHRLVLHQTGCLGIISAVLCLPASLPLPPLWLAHVSPPLAKWPAICSIHQRRDIRGHHLTRPHSPLPAKQV